MGIYRQSVVLKRHNSKIALLEAKMLLLYVFLLSCCLAGSMGRATEEFQKNFEDLIVLAKKEVFLPVPDGKFQCNCVSRHLRRTVEWLKSYFTTDETRTCVSLMEKNMDHIISTLDKGYTKPEKESSCQTAERLLRRAPRVYKSFFQKLHEKC